MAQWKRIRLGPMRLQVQSLASLSGLRIRHCHELWCGWQMRLRSGIAMAVGRPAAVAPIRPLAWEPLYAAGAAPKRKKKATLSCKDRMEIIILYVVGACQREYFKGMCKPRHYCNKDPETKL